MGPRKAALESRVVVFIDYQNVYRGARDAFGWRDSRGFVGNIRPLRLARLLAEGADRRLTQARVYTGVPVAERDPKGHAVMQRRLAAWKADAPGLVDVYVRSLRYPPRQGREKGVDVQLAVDVVRLAMENAYDVLVLASADSDLLPVLEFVAERYPEKAIETMGWRGLPEGDAAAPLDVRGFDVRRHRLTLDEFTAVEDVTNYFGRAPVVRPESGSEHR
jgi:uncharacterized LabA/DUF88 family protein